MTGRVFLFSSSSPLKEIRKNSLQGKEKYMSKVEVGSQLQTISVPFNMLLTEATSTGHWLFDSGGNVMTV